MKKLVYSDMRKPCDSHCYYVYVPARENVEGLPVPPCIYKVSSLSKLEKSLGKSLKELSAQYVRCW